MITQEIPISLLMDPQKMLIFRQGDYGNQIKIKFHNLTGITSAEFRLIKPDDTFVVSTGEIIENDIIITITQQMSILSGYAIFNLRLINSQSNIYTYVGRALIDDNINLDDYAASVAEVNGLVFPDDFLTEADLSQYATKEYVDEAVEDIPVYTPPGYSLTEQDTGLTWIDGKHIYQKTYHIIEQSERPDGDYSVVDINIDTPISCVGVLKFGSAGGNKWFTVPRHGGGGYYATVSASDANISIMAATYNYTEAYVTVNYTKTTDTV